MTDIFILINTFLENLLFFDILFGYIEGASVPFLVAWLIAGGVYLTFKMNFVNIV
jgi:AGCS family alanine or glycine:cation symporter